MSDDAKAPKFRMNLEDTEGNPIQPDWTFLASNQLTEITQNTAIIDNQKSMIAELEKIIELWEAITTRQSTMVDAIKALSEQMERTRLELRSSLTGILQVPITITLIAGASFLFYAKYIEEWTWLAVCAVAAFRYLGDSITGVVKLIGLRRGNGEQK